MLQRVALPGRFAFGSVLFGVSGVVKSNPCFCCDAARSLAACSSSTALSLASTVASHRRTAATSTPPSEAQLLDPPFTPPFKDERGRTRPVPPVGRRTRRSRAAPEQDQDDDGDSGNKEGGESFTVLCKCCRNQVFDSDGKLEGFPQWPTFCCPSSAVSDAALSPSSAAFPLRLKTESLESVTVTRLSPSSQSENEEDNRDDDDDDATEEQSNGHVVGQDDVFQKSTHRRRKSLKLLEQPPVMRWGADDSSIVDGGGDKMNDIESRSERYARKGMLLWQRSLRRRQRDKDSVPSGASTRSAAYHRGLHRITNAKRLRTRNFVRDSIPVCRGYCKKCDTFICMVSTGEPKSPTGQRFTCNPSSVIFAPTHP